MASESDKIRQILSLDTPVCKRTADELMIDMITSKPICHICLKIIKPDQSWDEPWTCGLHHPPHPVWLCSHNCMLLYCAAIDGINGMVFGKDIDAKIGIMTNF